MKVLVALGGGPESIVTAWLLKKQGKQLRGVYFDFLEHEKGEEFWASVERKLGIAIQIVPAKAEIEAVFRKEIASCLNEGKKIDLRNTFQQKYLFPKLFELKKQHQFQSIAGGHHATIRFDSAQSVHRVYRYPDLKEDESRFLIGLYPEDISTLEMPMGEITKTMAQKISDELKIDCEDYRVNWKAIAEPIIRDLLKGQQKKFADVVNENNMRVGAALDCAFLELGSEFKDESNSNITYGVWMIDSLAGRVHVGNWSSRKIQEIYVEDASWFTIPDLKMRALKTGMIWMDRNKAIPVKIIEFEGQRMKARLESPLVDREANIFQGDTLLWVDGSEVLGGARVTALL